VVAGVDDEETAATAVLSAAFAEAAARGAELLAVRAYGDGWREARAQRSDPAREEADRRAADALDRAVRPWRERYPDVVARPLAVRGAPRRTVLDAAHGAGLLVVGSRGLGAVTGALLGSVSRAAVHAAACPVLIVHPGIRHRG
jgi:nucleotide-binding universal stress UspA family protein